MYKLYSIVIDNDGEDNNYRFTPDENSKLAGAKEFVVRANDTMLKKFLRRCKVSDVLCEPRSYRSITYDEIIKLIQNQKGQIYIFAHMYPKSQSELEQIMRG